MIARRIPTGLGTGAFGAIDRLMNYLEGEDQERGEVRLTNFTSRDPVAARIEYVATQARNARAKSERNYHLVISFDSRDTPKLTPERLRQAEDELVEGMGYRQYQRMSIVHRDTHNVHVHVLVNLIHPRKYTIKVPWRDKTKLSNLCADLQDKLDLVRTDQGLGPKGPKLGRARETERRSGERSFAAWVLGELEIVMCRSWGEVHDRCAQRGVKLEASGRGLILTGRGEDGSRWVVASHRVFGGRGNLESRLGPFQHAKAEPRVPCSYRRAPLYDGGSSRFLYAEYRKSAEKLARERVSRLKRAREWRDAELARLAVERMTEIVRLAMQAVRRRFGEWARRIVSITTKKTWLQYLEAEAGRGRVEAAKELRKYMWIPKFGAVPAAGGVYDGSSGAGAAPTDTAGNRGAGSGSSAGGLPSTAVRILLADAAAHRRGAEAVAAHVVREVQKRGVDRDTESRNSVLQSSVPGSLEQGARGRDPGVRRSIDRL